MKLKKVLGKLGQEEVLGCRGTDWSWYYCWGIDRWGDRMILDSEGHVATFTSRDVLSSDWIIISKKELEKITKKRRKK